MGVAHGKILDWAHKAVKGYYLRLYVVSLLPQRAVPHY